MEQLRSGQLLLGKDGASAPLLESILNAALEGEMDSHLTPESRQSGNRRNGHMSKQIQTPVGPVNISTPRDRNSSFDPQTIKKRETFIADNIADKIISLYALGNSTREISAWVEDNLGQSLSADTISNITDRIVPDLRVGVLVHLRMFILSFGWMLSTIRLWMKRTVLKVVLSIMYWV